MSSFIIKVVKLVSLEKVMIPCQAYWDEFKVHLGIFNLCIVSMLFL